MYQALLVLKKNYKIFVRERQYIAELAAPTIIFLLLLLAKNTQVNNDDPNSSNNQQAQQSNAQFLPMVLLIYMRSIVSSMISEKSERQKETQKIMGLKSISYVIGWLMTNLLKLALLSIYFLGLTLSSGTFTSDTQLLTTPQLVLSFLMYGVATLAMGYFLSTLFDVPKSGADVAVFINIIGSVLTQLVTVDYIMKNPWLIYILSLLPSFCYGVVPYFQFINSTEQNFGTNDYFIMLTVDIILWIVLYLYADQVVPNEYGTNKHPLFFLTCFSNKRKVVYENSIDMGTLKEPLSTQSERDTSSAAFHEEFKMNKRKAVQIDYLGKQFKETKAVDRISLSLYSEQILCLLGHNGAGKTTTISLLTGLIKKDTGIIEYFGKNTDEHLDDIRTSYLGICPQKDVLYNSLTVEDHLEYYGKIKGLKGQQLQIAIQEVIFKCALENEKGKLAKNLSGGNKRKLCLGMAIIGGADVIFLDEPTSGMDPISRRKIWEILFQLRNEGKCLVLTTHHLDEAEVLSERIAIMAKGRLLTVGSVDFIKKNFGIGYHLNLYNISNPQERWQEKSQLLQETVRGVMGDVKLNPQTANQCVSFQIPFDQKSGFLSLFERLENDQTIQINLMMNTLEEAFINIGMDEDNFLNRTTDTPNPHNEINININDEFEKIIPPQCLERPPVYSFTNQFIACFLRKLYNLKGKRLVVQLIVPTVFMVVGPAMTYAVVSGFKDNDAIENFDETWAIVAQLVVFMETTMGISIASSSIGANMVQERELKQKYALNVMGCRILPFWFGSFAFDVIIFIYLWSILIILIIALGQTPLIHAYLFIMFFIYFCSYIQLSYALSWMFSEFLFAVKFLIFFLIFICFILPFIAYLLIQNTIFQWILTIIFPSVSCYGALNSYYMKEYDNDGVIMSKNPLTYIIILIFQNGLYFMITIALDARKLLASKNQGELCQAVDQDVLFEEERVRAIDCQDRIIASQISKVYANGYQAVKGTSFGVEPGTIFGLLGPNGAGKSTTFNMLTCRLKPSTGNIRLQGQQVEKGKGAIFQNVGICPQFDSLYEVQTPVQHLRIWAYLKGLKGQEVEDSIDYFLKVMQLTAYTKTNASQLSGGNKRKLCVALALMGGSNMQFFDEPSSGVDPIARRFLWNSIQWGVKLRQSAVMLTTHTMDEAESLCSKIAIQINGEFACFGTPQHLKRKFGEGYRVTVDFENADLANTIKEKVFQRFQNCVFLNENIVNKMTFKLNKEGFSFYQTFSFFLETMQNELKLITDFQLNQSTLEQVFMHFASQQEENSNDQQQMKQRKRMFTGCCGNDEDD